MAARAAGVRVIVVRRLVMDRGHRRERWTLRARLLRACICILLLAAAAFTIAGCSDDGDSTSSCACDWGDTCAEVSSACAATECEKPVCTDPGTDCTWAYADTSGGECSQKDVLGSCRCDSDDSVTYYRRSFAGDPEEDCESPDFVRCVYTPR